MNELDELYEFEAEDARPKPKRDPRANLNPKRRDKRPFKSRMRTPSPMDAVVGEIVLDLVPQMNKLGWMHRDGPHKGMPSLRRLMNETGLGYEAAYYCLRAPERRSSIGVETLARLCEAMHCQPGDLLRYVPRRTFVPGSLRSPSPPVI